MMTELPPDEQDAFIVWYDRAKASGLLDDFGLVSRYTQLKEAFHAGRMSRIGPDLTENRENHENRDFLRKTSPPTRPEPVITRFQGRQDRDYEVQQPPGDINSTPDSWFTTDPGHYLPAPPTPMENPGPRVDPQPGTRQFEAVETVWDGQDGS